MGEETDKLDKARREEARINHLENVITQCRDEYVQVREGQESLATDVGEIKETMAGVEAALQGRQEFCQAQVARIGKVESDTDYAHRRIDAEVHHRHQATDAIRDAAAANERTVAAARRAGTANIISMAGVVIAAIALVVTICVSCF